MEDYEDYEWVYINTRADNGHVHREEHEGNCVNVLVDRVVMLIVQRAQFV